MRDLVRNFTFVSMALNIVGAVAEYIHSGAGFYPAGVGAGFWLAAGWLWLTEAV